MGKILSFIFLLSLSSLTAQEVEKNITLNYGMGIFSPSKKFVLDFQTLIELKKINKTSYGTELSYLTGGAWGSDFSNKNSTTTLNFKKPDKVNQLRLGIFFKRYIYKDKFYISGGIGMVFSSVRIPEITELVIFQDGYQVSVALNQERKILPYISSGVSYETKLSENWKFNSKINFRLQWNPNGIWKSYSTYIIYNGLIYEF